MMGETKSGFVAVVGKPNVGKSTLMNALVGYKVAIVSNRPQTTRNRITAVLTEGDCQAVFLDTPGFHLPRTKLGQFMVREVSDAVEGVDMTLMVVEPSRAVQKTELELLEKLRERSCPLILVVNKLDTVSKEQLAQTIERYAALAKFDAVIPISALKGDGVDLVKREIMARLKPGPFYFPEDMVTDQPERQMVAEIVREKALRYLQDEVPHGIAVEVETFDESEREKLVRIGVAIFCEKASHKGIIIGKQGAMLKKIASAARHDMEELLDCKVFLECFVKVREWRNQDSMLRNFGYTRDK